MIMSKHKDTITNTNTAWSSWISHLFYNITKLLLLVCGGTSQLNQKNIMLRLVARFPLCSVRQPRDLPDVTDAADEQKNKKTKNKTNWTKKEQQKNKPKWHSQKTKATKFITKTNFLPDTWYTRKATVDKMDNVCFSWQIWISCFLWHVTIVYC